MVFIETSVFTRQIGNLISEDSYLELQNWIAELPTRGSLIQGSSGCRKLRWKTSGRGKRGGIRVIYYWLKESDQILMLFAYAKSMSADLTQIQVRQLGDLVKQEIRSVRNERSTF